MKFLPVQQDGPDPYKCKPEPTGPIIADGDYPSVSCGKDALTIYVWLCFHQQNDYDLCLEIYSDLPILPAWGIGHWLEYEVECCGWDMLRDYDRYREFPMADWAIELGVAPGQPFLVRIEAAYSSYYDYYSGGTEYDSEFHMEFIAAEKMSPAEEVQAWGDFLLNVKELDKEQGR